VDAPDYNIAPAAPIADELSRIARAEVDFSLALCGHIASDPSYCVHQCRKAIKRLRALIRLISQGDGDTARSIDRRLRDTGRMLADARDAEVIVRTAIGLGADDAGALFDRISMPHQEVPDTAVVQAVTELLQEVRAELDEFIAAREWAIESILPAIEDGFRKVDSGKRRFSESGNKHHAHDWRKGVQRCANQLRLVEQLNPHLAAGRLQELDALAEILGDYNDLSILRHALKPKHGDPKNKSITDLRKRAKVRQRELRKRLLESGESHGV
jgi:CHAD domain-containing protein